jgi:hypothetical protein
MDKKSDESAIGDHREIAYGWNQRRKCQVDRVESNATQNPAFARMRSVTSSTHWNFFQKEKKKKKKKKKRKKRSGKKSDAARSRIRDRALPMIRHREHKSDHEIQSDQSTRARQQTPH